MREVRFRGVEAARPTPEVAGGDRRAPRSIVIAPSNPIVSIGPILAVARDRPAHWRRHATAGVPVVAVSGIIGGKALKGPADRMLDLARPRVERPRRARRLYAGDRDHVRRSSASTRSSAPAIAALGLRTASSPTRS